MGLFKKKVNLPKEQKKDLNKSPDSLKKGKKISLLKKLMEILGKKKDYSEIKHQLYLADIDVDTVEQIIEKLTEEENSLYSVLSEFLYTEPIRYDPEALNIITVLGVNGAGKTTLISKIANYYKAGGAKILIAGADTYRAAAIEQISHWADRLGISFISHQQGADPGAVVFDAIEKAVSKDYSLLIIDTAGRLQNKEELNNQLKKINKIIERKIENIKNKPVVYHKMLVLDANLGKNSFDQAEIFNSLIKLNSFSLTKLDSTAKGGAVFSVCSRLNIPLSFVSFGEKIEMLKSANDEDFKQFIIERV